VRVRHQLQELQVRGREKRWLAREQLEHHDAERIEIGSTVDVLSPRRIFRRHVADLAFQHAGERLAGLAGSLGDTKVGDAHAAIEPHQEIAGRHVAMDDFERFPLVVAERVRSVEPFGRARRHERHELVRNPVARAFAGICDASERDAVDPLHHQIRAELVLAEAHKTHDVRVPERAHHPNFVTEHAQKLDVAGVFRVHALDRDGVLARVVDQSGDLDGAHPTARNLAEDDQLRLSARRGHGTTSLARQRLDSEIPADRRSGRAAAERLVTWILAAGPR
jgi:hypothetical protein